MLARGSRLIDTNQSKALEVAKPKSPSKLGKRDAAPPAPKAPLPEVQTPTLFVRYAVRWAGDIYSEEKGNRQFVGIVVNFDVSMRVPGEAETYDFELEVQPPDHFTVDYRSPYGSLAGLDLPGLGGPTEGHVYDVMASRAFDELTTKLRGVFFNPSSKANTASPAPSIHRPSALDQDDDEDEPENEAPENEIHPGTKF
jgi:hypothetical protein